MKLLRQALRLLCLIALLSLATHAHAQVGVYGTLIATHVNNPTSAQSIAFGGTNTGYWTTGGGFGVYYDAFHLGPVSLGLDLRGSRASQAKTGLGGVRVAIHPPILPIKPYFEGLAGGTSTTTIYNGTATNFVYEIVGGVDYTIIPHLDFRAIEIGAGRISTGITTAPTGNSTLLTVSSGIAIHF